MSTVHIIGGGLAGSEAAWQCLRAGLKVRLYEMRPLKMTAAHQSGNLAELVCSNSLKSTLPDSAPGLLKAEMEHLDSLIIRAAKAAAVPAGMALAVERNLFSRGVAKRLRVFQPLKESTRKSPTSQALRSWKPQAIFGSLRRVL